MSTISLNYERYSKKLTPAKHALHVPLIRFSTPSLRAPQTPVAEVAVAAAEGGPPPASNPTAAHLHGPLPQRTASEYTAALDFLVDYTAQAAAAASSNTYA
jgi:hypothetical protein